MNLDSGVRHILVIEDRESRRTISLDDTKYTIGRHSSNTVPICSKQISRRHATLIRKNNRQTQQYSFWILDGDLEGNKSYNGVFINGEKSLVHELQEGDLINFGCEVNASYHRIISAQEAGSGGSLQTEVLSGLNSPNEQNTLIVDRDHLSLELEGETTVEERSVFEEETFQEQSYLDPVTQLPNAILFKEYVSIALNNAQRKKLVLAVVLIEIDHYEQIRETHGEALGDRLMIDIAKRLKDILRSVDIVARYQENQFAILLPQVGNLTHLPHITQRITKTIQRPLECGNQLIYLTCYQSLALYPQDGTFEDQLFAAILDKLEQRKTTKLADAIPDPGPTFSERLSRAEVRLKTALNKAELEMYYQPQVNIKTGKVTGMEALIRWNHPQQGVLSPAHFWPWAEKTDLVFPLTYWIFQNTFQQQQLWQKDWFTPLTLSVNLSSRQFYHPQLANVLVHCLMEARIEPNSIELEVTESTILEETNAARAILHSLEQIGVSLSMDNFGIGHGAINYLQEFPFNQLKIDRSLITKLNDDPKSQSMTQALITIAQNFDIKVVAEGVETLAQIKILEQLNCDAMQGYQLSRPLTVDDAQEFLKKHFSKS